MRIYCVTCNKHQVHKVKAVQQKYKAGRTLAWRSRQMSRRLMGYHGKVKGKAKVKKQGTRNKLILECQNCKKKSERVIGTRQKKKAEVAR